VGYVSKVTLDVSVTWRKGARGRGVTAPHMLNLGNLQGRVVSFTGWPHLTRLKKPPPPYPLKRGWVAPDPVWAFC